MALQWFENKRLKTLIALTLAVLIFSAFHLAFNTKQAAAAEITEIRTAEDLDNIRADLKGHYKLMNDIDLDIAPYNTGNGWEPIGPETYDNNFQGIFDGNGKTISGLMVDRDGRAGLFGSVGGAAKIFNVTLSDVDITGTTGVGGLIGQAYGGPLLENLTVTGKVHSTANGGNAIGGLAGSLTLTDIKNSHADVIVTGGGTHARNFGGLVGYVGNGKIENSTSAGEVNTSATTTGGLVGSINGAIVKSSSSVNVKSTHTENDYNRAGGLAGHAGKVTDSFATGKVETVGDIAGGLIGTIMGMNVEISNSYATGDISGKNYVGGLVGDTDTSGYVINNSYATGNVYGEDTVGGLVSELTGANAAVQKSFATGNVIATGNNVGGLVGNLTVQAKIQNAYARGSVTGNTNVGGLVGNNEGSTIERSYATGAVIGEGTVGGLVGKDISGKYSLNAAPNFYDEEATGQTDDTGATPTSTANMKTEGTFTNWDFRSTWQIDANTNDGYPFFGKRQNGSDEPPVDPDGGFGGPGDTPFFTDTSGHWAQDQISEAVDLGYFTGYADETFKPNNPITRAEFAVIIDRALELDTSNMSVGRLNDIGNHWAKEAIEKAQQAGIVTGYADGSFRPNNQVSRAEIAAMVTRALGLEANTNNSTGFSDDGQIPSWAKGYAITMNDLGIMTGRSGNLFVPNANTTRAEGAVILLRSVEIDR